MVLRTPAACACGTALSLRLLDACNRPRAAVVSRFAEVPNFVEGGGRAAHFFAHFAVEAHAHHLARGFLFEGNDLDSVQGYVITKDVLRAALAGRHNVELSKLKRDISFIPENVTLERALEQFLQQRQQLFMVVDEHGGVEGLLSMEDVLETMLGVEIVDEADHVVDLRQLAKQRRDARVRRLGERLPAGLPEGLP